MALATNRIELAFIEINQKIVLLFRSYFESHF